MTRPPWIALVLGVLPALAPGSGTAQEGGATAPDVEGYYRSLGKYFRVSPGEVRVLASWGLPPEHLAVVLFMHRRAGVSPDVVVSRRRGGLSWSEVARQSGLDASAFHVLMSQDASLGMLRRAYGLFDTTPRREWSSIRLSDDEIVGLVNVGILSALLGVSPSRVLEATTHAGSFVAAHHRLRASG